VTRDWEAATYDRVSGPQVEWAERVLDRLSRDAGASGRLPALGAPRTALERLSEDLRKPYIEAVVRRFEEEPTLDYVRLNIDARRPE
jgi:hypothetical protein